MNPLIRVFYGHQVWADAERRPDRPVADRLLRSRAARRELRSHAGDDDLDEIRGEPIEDRDVLVAETVGGDDVDEMPG